MAKFQKLAASLMLALGALGAQAATLYTAGATAAMETPGSVTATFGAAAGAGLVDVQLQGYATLDGDNFYIDAFHLSVNGTEVFSGTWDLGGGGTDRVLLDTTGASVSVSHPDKTVTLSVPVSLANGTNTVTFAYDSPLSFEGSGRAGFQGLGDEGWGVNSIKITGTVPEPETYGLILAGLAVVGTLRGRAKSR